MLVCDDCRGKSGGKPRDLSVVFGCLAGLGSGGSNEDCFRLLRRFVCVVDCGGD